jgi:SAM-dependent methyltransferase
VSFEVARAQSYPGAGYDLVACFDCLHDMGDPVGAARNVHRSLAPDGTWLLVEPMAGDRIEDNLNPVGRVFYGASAMICTPAARSQEGGFALGAQAGERQLRALLEQAGFGRVRRAAETPFNLVLEVRP